MDALIKALSEFEKMFSGSNSLFNPEAFLSLANEALDEANNLGFINLKEFITIMKSNLEGKKDVASEELQMFQFAVATIKEHLTSSESDISKENLREVLDMIGISYDNSAENNKDDSLDDTNEDDNEIDTIESIIEGPSSIEELDLSNLRRLFERFGAHVDDPSTENPEYFTIRFPARKLETERLERILSMSDPDEKLTEPFYDKSLKKIILGIKEFMISFSQGDLERSKNVLKDISSNLGDGELFNEIGQIARRLHESLKSVSNVLDPHLREFVETKIPDSGNRLEHILKLTENAAITTLDHLESLQNRKEQELGNLSHIQQKILSLHPLGEEAKNIIDDILKKIESIEQLSKEDKEDFITILTAQDYQDLTGQIILKIIGLLNDLEQRLVDLIKTFGVKVKEEKAETERKKEEKTLLYGPAHDKKKDALRSQDEVDALLAEFGF